MLSNHAPLSQRFLNQLPGQAWQPVTTAPSDAQLVAAARQGDAAAFGTLVRRYQDRLCTSLRYVCGSLADAQDAAQEAFLRAYVKLDSYTGSSAFYTWLYRIAVNQAVSEHRRRKTRTEKERLRYQEEQELHETAAAPDENLLRDERVAKVQKALDHLSSDHRAILVLREIEDRDYDEISCLLNIPVGTVRSRLHRARLELREEIVRTPSEP